MKNGEQSNPKTSEKNSTIWDKLTEETVDREPTQESHIKEKELAEESEEIGSFKKTAESAQIEVNDEYLDAKNSHNGPHFMLEEENAEYDRLWRTDMKAAIKYLREKWAEHVDRDFIQSFRCIHWMSNYDMATHIEEMLGDGKHEKEISTEAYSSSRELRAKKRWRDSKVGLLINGTVNLASNADIQTNQWHGVLIEEDDDRKRRKYTEYANRLMTNRDNCVSPYEFVIGNWNVEAIVADPDAITPELIMLSEKYNIPIIATDDESLFSESNSSQDEK
jgi:hypothetical protein